MKIKGTDQHDYPAIDATVPAETLTQLVQSASKAYPLEALQDKMQHAILLELRKKSVQAVKHITLDASPEEILEMSKKATDDFIAATRETIQNGKVPQLFRDLAPGVIAGTLNSTNQALQTGQAAFREAVKQFAKENPAHESVAHKSALSRTGFTR